MNKFFKIVVSILGGVNAAFSIFVPVALVLTVINIFQLSQFNIIFLMIIGILATIYRAIKVLIK